MLDMTKLHALKSSKWREKVKSGNEMVWSWICTWLSQAGYVWRLGMATEPKAMTEKYT